MENTEKLVNDLIVRFGTLLEKSEQRIDTTNRMVLALADSIKQQNSLTNEIKDLYVKHIDQVCASRDRAEKMNLELAESLKRQQALCELVIDKIAAIAQTKTASTNVNVK